MGIGRATARAAKPGGVTRGRFWRPSGCHVTKKKTRWEHRTKTGKVRSELALTSRVTWRLRESFCFQYKEEWTKAPKDFPTGSPLMPHSGRPRVRGHSKWSMKRSSDPTISWTCLRPSRILRAVLRMFHGSSGTRTGTWTSTSSGAIREFQNGANLPLRRTNFARSVLLAAEVLGNKRDSPGVGCGGG